MLRRRAVWSSPRRPQQAGRNRAADSVGMGQRQRRHPRSDRQRFRLQASGLLRALPREPVTRHDVCGCGSEPRDAMPGLRAASAPAAPRRPADGSDSRRCRFDQLHSRGRLRAGGGSRAHPGGREADGAGRRFAHIQGSDRLQTGREDCGECRRQRRAL